MKGIGEGEGDVRCDRCVRLEFYISTFILGFRMLFAAEVRVSVA